MMFSSLMRLRTVHQVFVSSQNHQGLKTYLFFFNSVMIFHVFFFFPAIMDVLLSQQCAKILVGDPHQQIYTFKGAVNALSTVEHTHIYFLTQVYAMSS